MNDPLEQQRRYYAQVAAAYDSAFAFDPDDEHFVACALFSGLARHYSLESVLDVGCGTGRAITYFSKSLPSLRVIGVEPVPEMRNAAVASGLSPDLILPGDATCLPFADGAFDCATAFGVLHHIPEPQYAIREMFRVARRAVFISDHNIYGMGSALTRGMKQVFRDCRARWLLRLLLTRGKGFHDTTWDGVFYPFSLVDHLELIRSLSSKVHILPTRRSALNVYRQTSHFAVLAIV